MRACVPAGRRGGGAQVEADIRPFRGLLLAMFFVTTGTSIDLDLLGREWPNVAALVAGLIAVKSFIVLAAGPAVGLSRAESLRTGLLLGQGGEFAFVVFTLANDLEVLPEELNKLLIIVVVISMALTPALAEAGAWAYEAVNRLEAGGADPAAATEAIACTLDGQTVTGSEIVICGFGPQGQTLANMLRAAAEGRNAAQVPCYVAFDLDPARVSAARRRGLNVQFGDASRLEVLRAAGVRKPAALVVAYARPEAVTLAVRMLRKAYGPEPPIFARARDAAHGVALREEGATAVVMDSLEAGLVLGNAVLQDLGVEPAESSRIATAMRAAIQRSDTLVRDQQTARP